MKWTEITGVEKNVDFNVKGLSETYRIVEQPTGFQRIAVVIPGGELIGASAWAYDEIINSAPSGIIHLPPPLTDEQREQLKALYTLGYRWLAKDENGATYAYDKQKLAKGLTVWLSQERGCSRIHDGMAEDVIIPLVSWSDPEPYDIGKALGVEGC